MDKNRKGVILAAVIKSKVVKVRPDWPNEEYLELVKEGLLKRSKVKINSMYWNVYKITTKGEQVYKKIKNG